MNFNINYDNLMLAVKLMGQGMLGIFIVMAVISIIVFLLTKFSKEK
ncbi:MAG: sodium pump decarboxylase gamma subunit [Clostridia bacterium]|nr:sodium pump decarboxylase gamma subunit [Clostridia bacterium]MBQ9994073.1 sodium pump decarboxylase gamma subunit [Clostridia bacterium]